MRKRETEGEIVTKRQKESMQGWERNWSVHCNCVTLKLFVFTLGISFSTCEKDGYQELVEGSINGVKFTCDNIKGTKAAVYWSRGGVSHGRCEEANNCTDWNLLARFAEPSRPSYDTSHFTINSTKYDRETWGNKEIMCGSMEGNIIQQDKCMSDVICKFA